MPEFIPNQPITFGAIAQDCLNNDPRAYAMLMQGEEQWKLQIENTSCGNAEGAVCDPEMNDVGEVLINSSFDTVGEWTVVQDATINTTDGFAYLFDNSVGGGESIIEIDLPVSNSYISYPTVCKISFDISTFQSGSFYVNAELPGNTYNLQTFTPSTNLNSYSFTVYRPWFAEKIIVGFVCNQAYSLYLQNFVLEEITPCWSQLIDYNGSTGVNALSSPSWTYSNNFGIGKFTSVPNWDIYNSATFPVATLLNKLNDLFANGDFVKLTYTLSGITAGSIYASLGTTSGVIRNANGTYTELIVSGAIADALFWYTTQDFDGSIQIVSAYKYLYCHTIDVVDANTLTPVATGYVPDYVNDKIEMVFNPQSIPGEVGGEPNDFALVDGCYRIKFNDCCTGESVISDTVINYTTGTHDCTVLVDATCDGEAFGFDFSANFSIRHRLRTLRFNPTYRNEGEDSQGSDGVKRRPFAQSEKVYSCLFDYCDEPTHDAINAQLLCDTLTFDGVEYFYPIQDYSPDWSDRGKLNLAQSQIELQKKQSVIFNRNCV
jgi:hypothetical protein